ncbi:HlyD family efflux transporter periplasmic adaptor subunit [Cereibacter sphaeroides]|uniref:HlyD family secretion protein n=1 Tax=Cereibacter sphaeroides TaxID=1063 RepID=UPI001F3B2664|nr:HlyD family efflux transporter periplasmic adaptor subunit [Cereibacter sphaeroides]MCE6961851.1 HlyD family efflux transporter periplasmic adaptor subunit [Cereibacter sphaeroides]MCE6970626.1 HlyD family efflux transporter periplasmic adaptor subunit [Cereibacter sphaeroides]MCE6975778.1 HlyD family efflux transporter periplasmic adaptor subunit [Cereibacter sphaeroides]
MTFPDTILGLFAAFLGAGEPQVWNGYAEADTILVAPVSPGRIVTVAAGEGDLVTAGDPLVELEGDAEKAALAATHAAVAVAEANLGNLRTGGRDEEIAVIAASLHRAEADLGLASITLDRSEQLLAQGRVPQATVDQDRAALTAAEAQVEQLRAELAVAHLPAREGERLAAEAALRQARAEADAAQVALDNRRLIAPIGGRVETRFHDPGEVVAAGAPILSLYDPARLHAVFFLPEEDRLRIAPGTRLALTCTGCPEGLTATVTELATDPQYTPPIIYSREERARLVFRAEAELDAESRLMPGQPVTLEPLP